MVIGSSTKTAFKKEKQRDSSQKKASRLLVRQTQNICCDDFNTFVTKEKDLCY